MPVRAIVSSDGRTAAPGLCDWFEPYGVALGVGNQEDPVTEVRGANGRSRYAVPVRVIPARGQVGEDPAPSVGVSKESCDVLHEHVSGSSHAHDVPEPGPTPPLVGSPELAASSGEGLTGEASGHEIGSGTSQVCPPLGGGADVVMTGNLRPVLGQHALAERIELHLAHARPAGAVEPQVEAADP
jgi:hypothetical protein